MFKKLAFFILVTILSTSSVFAQKNETISQKNLQTMMSVPHKNKMLLLDVRTPQEYAEGHVPGAINISYDTVKDNLNKLLPYKNKTVVVYCRSGHRAGIAKGILAENGFTKLLHLNGDMNGWYAAKLPVEK